MPGTPHIWQHRDLLPVLRHGPGLLFDKSPELAQVSLAEVERVAGELGFRSLRRERVPAAFNANLRCQPGSKP